MAKPNKERLNITKEQKKFLFNKLGITDIKDIDTAVFKLFKEKLKVIKDPRQKGKKHFKIWDIIVCTVIARLGNCDTWDEIHDYIEDNYTWFKKFLKLTGGVPSEFTIKRVISLINSKELEQILQDFFMDLTNNFSSKKDILDIDGRVTRGSSRNQTIWNEKIKPLNVLNAYSNNMGLCLASEQIDEKTNEIPKVPDILKRLNIQNTIITWDALNTQIENVKAVISGFGDYVVPIKGNHPNFYDDLKLYFDDKKIEMIVAGKLDSAYKFEIEKSHGKLIKYEYYQTSDIKWYFEYESWIGLKTIGMVRKTIIEADKTTIECRYYISSLPINIKEFSEAIRMHWSVENKLHWHLDFTFREDKNTTMDKKLALNLQIIDKFLLGVLNRVKLFYGKSLRRIRAHVSHNPEIHVPNIICYSMLV